MSKSFHSRSNLREPPLLGREAALITNTSPAAAAGSDPGVERPPAPTRGAQTHQLYPQVSSDLVLTSVSYCVKVGVARRVHGGLKLVLAEPDVQRLVGLAEGCVV